ncbi:MAG: DUF3108 domain-containing protein [Parvibaculum sp.]
MKNAAIHMRDTAMTHGAKTLAANRAANGRKVLPSAWQLCAYLAVAGFLGLTSATFAMDRQPAPPLVESIDVNVPKMAMTAIDLAYEIYGGGLHVVSFGTQAVLTPRTYEIASQFQTEGMADTLFNGRASSAANGLLTPQGPRLLAYEQEYDGRFGQRSIAMTLDQAGQYTVAAMPEDGIHEQGFTSEIVRGRVDPLTASIFTAINQHTAPCNTSIPVFDGRRVFNLEFSSEGETDLNPQGAGTYQGRAILCKVNYKPVAGFTRKFMLQQARDPLKPFTVWLARFDNVMGPGGTQPLVIPVRMEVETPVVNAIAHLVEAEVDGHHLIRAATPTN